MRKKKTIKAWLICDGKDKPLMLTAGEKMGKAITALYLTYNNQKEADETWHGMNIHECTITYKI